jgi:hypothetical protein
MQYLATEYSTRLVATGSAAEWLMSRIDATRRQLATIHRETATQELLHIVSGVRRQQYPTDNNTAKTLPEGPPQ